MSERLTVGDTPPSFTLLDDSGNTLGLSDLAGKKAIIYFYPAALTPGCTKQACDFTETFPKWQADGYTIVGVSPDKPEKLAKFREKEDLAIILLSDPDKQVMTQWGAFGEKKLYGKTIQGVIRSTVVLDEHGTVSHAWYNVKATGHVAKVRRDLGLD